MGWQVHRLSDNDVSLMGSLSSLFGEAFGEPETYGGNRPDAAYLRRLLADEGFIALAVLHADQVVGGLVAYELKKFEQPRSEIYIYDLAVAETYRRQGIATALIRRTCELATSMGAWVVFVQADYQDAPAVALYTKLGAREEVLHFDIEVEHPYSRR